MCKNIIANVIPDKIATITKKEEAYKRFLPFVQGCRLADQFIGQGKQKRDVDILLGIYYVGLIQQGGPRTVQQGMYIQNSMLGWLTFGHVDGVSNDDPSVSFLITTSTLNYGRDQPEIDREYSEKIQLSDLWSLEKVGIMDKPSVNEDEMAMNMFKESVKYVDKRYEVDWPWKDEKPDIPTNYGLAFGRLQSVVRRLSKEPELMQKYDAIIQEQLQKGIIEKVQDSKEECPNDTHYLPHHPVITPDKATTKVRIVYDGSAKTNQSARSLNESMFRGPVILDNLAELLIQFRMHKIAVIADIEKHSCKLD